MRYIESVCSFGSFEASLRVIISVFYCDLSMREIAKDAIRRQSRRLEEAILEDALCLVL